MGLYEVPLSVSLFGFGMGTMLANFHMCLIGRQPGIVVRMPTLINQLFNDESIAVQIIFCSMEHRMNS